MYATSAILDEDLDRFAQYLGYEDHDDLTSVIRVDDTPYGFVADLLSELTDLLSETYDEQFIPEYRELLNDAANAGSPSTIPANRHSFSDEEEYVPSWDTGYSNEQLRRDTTAKYTIFVDNTAPLKNYESESIIAINNELRLLHKQMQWLKRYRMKAMLPLYFRLQGIASQLYSTLENTTPAIVDRCEYWDGFVIREKHIAYTRSLFFWNDPNKQLQQGAQEGDFWIGNVYVSQVNHVAWCGICNQSKWLDNFTLEWNEPTREEKEELTLRILQHSLEHSKKFPRGKILAINPRRD